MAASFIWKIDNSGSFNSLFHFKPAFMAEFLQPNSNSRKKLSGAKRSKKLSTRVDLTPMVDLGFLLITFFIFTTTLSKPRAMHLVLPKDSRDPMLLKSSGALTLIPVGNDRLYYYEGYDPTRMQSASFQSLRQIIRNKKNNTNPIDLMIILKPSRTCSFKNTIAALDEMAINEIGRYALVELSAVESGQIVQ
jgi:biopolymer transport protein ExbD